MKAVFCLIQSFFKTKKEGFWAPMIPPTICDNKVFARTYKKGKNFVSPLLVTYIMKTKRGGVSFGITASKKIGCAVKRNRARRIMKEAFLKLVPELSNQNVALVFVARGKTCFVKTEDVLPLMRKHLQSAGMLSTK